MRGGARADSRDRSDQPGTDARVGWRFAKLIADFPTLPAHQRPDPNDPRNDLWNRQEHLRSPPASVTHKTHLTCENINQPSMQQQAGRTMGSTVHRPLNSTRMTPYCHNYDTRRSKSTWFLALRVGVLPLLFPLIQLCGYFLGCAYIFFYFPLKGPCFVYCGWVPSHSTCFWLGLLLTLGVLPFERESGDDHFQSRWNHLWNQHNVRTDSVFSVVDRYSLLRIHVPLAPVGFAMPLDNIFSVTLLAFRDMQELARAQ